MKAERIDLFHRRKEEMLRGLKISWVLFLTLCLLGFMGGSSLLMADEQLAEGSSQPDFEFFPEELVTIPSSVKSVILNLSPTQQAELTDN